VRSESSTSFSLEGAKVPGNESSRERKYQRAKVPCMELSFPGAKVRGNESSCYQTKWCCSRIWLDWNNGPVPGAWCSMNPSVTSCTLAVRHPTRISTCINSVVLCCHQLPVKNILESISTTTSNSHITLIRWLPRQQGS